MGVPDKLSDNLTAEEIYRIMADFTHDWEELRALDGTLIYISPSCERISGYPPEEYYANHRLLFDLIHPDDKEMVMAHHEQVRQHLDQNHRIEFRLLHRNGGIRWIERHTQPAFYPDGGILGYRNSHRDFTARKQAEIEAMRNHNTALALLDNPVAIALILNLDGTIRMANQTFAQRFGKSQAELVGMVSWDLLPESLREKRKTSVQQVIQTGQPLRYQDQGVHGFYDNIIYPIYDERGQMFQIGVQARDITEIIQEKAALEESEATIRSFINVPSTIMLLLDIQGIIITANTAFVEMLRAALPDTPDAEALKGLVFWDILPSLASDIRKAGFEKVLRTIQPLNVEERSPTGAWYDTWVYPILNEKGEVFRVAVIGHDITDRKRAEDTVRQNEATIRALLNVPDMLVVLLDLQANIVLANQTFAGAVNEMPDALIGKYAFGLLFSEATKYRKSIFDQVAQSGKAQRFTDDRSQQGRVFDSLIYPILDAQGQVKQVAVMSRDLTELHKTAEELKVSQQRLKTLLSHMPGLLFVFDPQGTLKLVEGKILNTLGLDPQSLTGLKIADVMGPAYDPKPYLEKIVSGEMQWEELVFGEFTYDLYFSRIMDQEDQVVEIIGVALDKTELKKSQQFLKNVLNNLPGILVVLDPKGQIKLIEGSMLNQIGFSPQDLVGRRSAEILGLENETEFWLENVLSGKLTREYIFYGERVFESNYSLTMDQNNQVAEVIGFTLDKTEERKTQDQLQQVKNQLQVVLEGVADGIVATNQARQVIYANQAAAQMTGFTSADDLTSTSADDLISQFDILDQSGQIIPREDLPGRRSFSGERKAPIEIHLRNKLSGKETWVEVKDTPISDEKGQTQLVVTVFHDITTAKREQHLQEQSRKELAQMVAERTAEIERVNQKLIRENQARRKSEDGYRRSAAQAQSLAEVSARLNARLDLQTVLQTISQEIIRATRYPLCTVMLYDEKSDALVIESASGKFADIALQSGPLPRSAFETYRKFYGPMFVIEDVSAIPNNPYQDIHTKMKARTVISLPLELEENLVGSLTVHSLGKIHLPTEEEKTFLLGLANLATTAIINARLYQEAQEGRTRLQILSRQLVEAQETERRKLVRQLHDDVGQTITYLNMLLDSSLKATAAENIYSDKMEREIRRARQLTDEMLQRIHELSSELRPPMLDDFGLLPALLDYFEGYSKQTGVQVQFKHGLPGIRYKPELEDTAFRVIQQALINVARHAKTDQVAVRIWSLENTLGLQIEDNGVGFDIKTVLDKKLTGGLPNMREQVALIGGTLEIETALGGGTCLTAEIPLAG